VCERERERDRGEGDGVKMRADLEEGLDINYKINPHLQRKSCIHF
jgi:hypothetical protein